MLSVTEPIQRSIDWTRKLLFTPFALGKWCAMGFTVFLANFLAGGGSSVPTGNPMKGAARSSLSPTDGLEEAWTWGLAHLPLIITILVLFFALALVVQWLGARGQFMFLDNVVNDRGRVAEPWSNDREHGNRVFFFMIILDLATLAVVAAGLLAGWRLARPDLADLHFGLHALKGLLAALAIILPLCFVLAMTSLLLRDFVVPVMYLRGTTVGEGFRVFRDELLPGHGWSFVLFYLMKFVLSLAAGILVTFGTCLTCCLAGLPYVSSVVFLPVFVFFRSYSLHFLGQCGEEWRLLA